MRKVFQIFVVIILSFTLLGSSNANMDGIFLFEYPKQSLLYESLDPEAASLAGNLVVLPEDDFDQVEAANIIGRLTLLPESMIKKAINQNIKVRLFEGNLTDNPTASHLKGVIPRGYTSKRTWDQVPGIGGSRVVLVKIGSSEKGKGHGSVNLELHELAHSLDRHVYDGIREEERFLTIWKQESRVLFPGRAYFLDYPEEYFAECFAMYYIGGMPARLLKEAAPQTYHYIEALK
ncbi:toxin [Mesobacillus sp. AQ2]|jgi:Pro-Pro endopeptidase|uniref:anthrax toxin lethal factor-related metalloendopeptidase n=1 Tax=Bacillaceae TaxID=186817 RepID=UPI0011A669E8|nr:MULTISPECIES: toxin [Bacillaceae]MCM3122094.1 toxin [Mesobacillus sp. MER 33]MCM3232058.1 toxin [Mesobacillus sp. MER 48]WHX39013.1 toxin [Mesobacillus sp. AQ2]